MSHLQNGLRSFAQLLRTYRENLPKKRATQVRMGRYLHLAGSVISRWETNEFAIRMPSADQLMSLAQYLALTPSQCKDFIEAASRDPRTTRAQAADYTKLLEEQGSQKLVYGPLCPTIDTWQQILTSAKKSYFYGEFRSASSETEELLDDLTQAITVDAPNGLWSDVEVEELSKLWLESCYVFYDATCLLETRAKTETIIVPRLRVAVDLAIGAGDPELKAIPYHVMGDLYRRRRDYQNAMWYHKETLKFLKDRPNALLVGLTQRFVILDAPYAYKFDQHQILQEIKLGRQLIDGTYTDNARECQHVRSFLFEAIGRTLGVIGDPHWRVAMHNAQNETKEEGHIVDRVVFLSTLYSSALAEVSHPDATDMYYLESLATTAENWAEALGQGRRLEQLQQIRSLARLATLSD
jgi:transcriptional regulator with XRE-family HTH domain